MCVQDQNYVNEITFIAESKLKGKPKRVRCFTFPAFAVLFWTPCTRLLQPQRFNFVKLSDERGSI